MWVIPRRVILFIGTVAPDLVLFLYIGLLAVHWWLLSQLLQIRQANLMYLYRKNLHIVNMHSLQLLLSSCFHSRMKAKEEKHSKHSRYNKKCDFITFYFVRFTWNDWICYACYAPHVSPLLSGDHCVVKGSIGGLKKGMCTIAPGKYCCIYFVHIVQSSVKVIRGFKYKVVYVHISLFTTPVFPH